MVSPDHPLIQLWALIDRVWAEPEARRQGRGAPKRYSEKVMFKVYVVSLLKTLWERRSLWRYLQANPTVATACSLARIPDRRTLDRRLVEIAPHAEMLRILNLQQIGNAAQHLCNVVIGRTCYHHRFLPFILAICIQRIAYLPYTDRRIP